MRLAIVVAMTRSRLIGKDGKLPWHIPEDMKHFRNVTLNHAVIMGRKTFESIGKPLPKRRNIVISNTMSHLDGINGIDVVTSLDKAICLANMTGDDEPRVIGGAAIYAEALPKATTIYLTDVMLDLVGDTYFPVFDLDKWEVIDRKIGEDKVVSFVTLTRK